MAGSLPASVFDQQIAVAEDGREQVVEIVSDAAGEPADGLHFLGLAKMVLALAQGLLGQFAFRNIVNRQQNHLEMIEMAASEDQAPAPHARKILLRLRNPGTSCRREADRPVNRAGRECPNCLSTANR